MTNVYDADEKLLLEALLAEKWRLVNGSALERQEAPSKITILGAALHRLHKWRPPEHVLRELAGVYDPAYDDTPIENLAGETPLGLAAGDVGREAGQSGRGT